MEVGVVVGGTVVEYSGVAVQEALVQRLATSLSVSASLVSVRVVAAVVGVHVLFSITVAGATEWASLADAAVPSGVCCVAGPGAVGAYGVAEARGEGVRFHSVSVARLLLATTASCPHGSLCEGHAGRRRGCVATSEARARRW